MPFLRLFRGTFRDLLGLQFLRKCVLLYNFFFKRKRKVPLLPGGNGLIKGPRKCQEGGGEREGRGRRREKGERREEEEGEGRRRRGGARKEEKGGARKEVGGRREEAGGGRREEGRGRREEEEESLVSREWRERAGRGEERGMRTKINLHLSYMHVLNIYIYTYMCM